MVIVSSLSDQFGIERGNPQSIYLLILIGILKKYLLRLSKAALSAKAALKAVSNKYQTGLKLS